MTNPHVAREALKFLQDKLREERNESDPNIDLFLATIDEDVEALKDALRRNANPNIELPSILNKYSVELGDFTPSLGDTLWKPQQTGRSVN